MKKILLLFLFFPMFAAGQTFCLTDTTFHKNNYVYRTKIEFDLGKWTIRQNSYAILDSVVAFLIRNPGITMEVGNHTDTRANDSYSQLFTRKRAMAIVEYLSSKGIQPERLSAKEYEDIKPLIKKEAIAKLKTNDEKELAHSLNRRTEFKILSTDYREKKIFLVEENPDGCHHSISIDTTHTSPFYRTDFRLRGEDYTAYENSLSHLRSSKTQLKKWPGNQLPKKWVIVKFYKEKLYTYKPCDYLYHYQLSINDTTLIEFKGEGPEGNVIADYKKTDDQTFSFNLKGASNESRTLIIHIFDKEKGLAVFEDIQPNVDTNYFIMIDAEKIRKLPLIINYCPCRKYTELKFTEPDYKVFIKRK